MRALPSGGPRSLRRIALAWLGLMVVLLVVFGLFEALGIRVFEDVGLQLDRRESMVAALGVSLLILDAVLPVPSSVVMAALGAIFGVAAGTALSTAGGLGGVVFAAAIGRAGRASLERGSSYDRERAAAFVARYGAAAIVCSRPVPILAESVAMMAGATGMGWVRLVAAGAAGTVPVALLYAVAGDRGSQASIPLLILLLVVPAMGAIVLAGIRARRHAPDRA